MREELSVVIAAKDPPAEQFLLCLTSLAALANARMLQIVLVASGTLPAMPATLMDHFRGFKFVEVPPDGVYAAYNTGCDHADGVYTLFFGADDIALPGMDTLIDTVLLKDAGYQMVAAACYMQSTGISKPSRHRTGLIFANWCHQGIFYQTAYIKCHRYEDKYRIQADHKMNIDLVANRDNRVFISDLLVAYFSAGGISSTTPDLVFRADYPAIVAQAYGRPWGWLIRLKQIAIDLVKGSPEKRFKSNYRR